MTDPQEIVGRSEDYRAYLTHVPTKKKSEAGEPILDPWGLAFVVSRWKGVHDGKRSVKATLTLFECDEGVAKDAAQAGEPARDLVLARYTFKLSRNRKRRRRGANADCAVSKARRVDIEKRAWKDCKTRRSKEWFTLVLGDAKTPVHLPEDLSKGEGGYHEIGFVLEAPGPDGGRVRLVRTWKDGAATGATASVPMRVRRAEHWRPTWEQARPAPKVEVEERTWRRRIMDFEPWERAHEQRAPLELDGRAIEEFLPPGTTRRAFVRSFAAENATISKARTKAEDPSAKTVAKETGLELENLGLGTWDIAKAFFVLHDTGIYTGREHGKDMAKSRRKSGGVHGFLNADGSYIATWDFSQTRSGTVFDRSAYTSKDTRYAWRAGGKKVRKWQLKEGAWVPTRHPVPEEPEAVAAALASLRGMRWFRGYGIHVEISPPIPKTSWIRADKGERTLDALRKVVEEALAAEGVDHVCVGGPIRGLKCSAKESKRQNGKKYYYVIQWTEAILDSLADLYIYASARAGHLLTITAHQEVDRNLVSGTLRGEWTGKLPRRMGHYFGRERILRSLQGISQSLHGDPRGMDVAVLYQKITERLRTLNPDGPLANVDEAEPPRYGIEPTRMRRPPEKKVAAALKPLSEKDRARVWRNRGNYGSALKGHAHTFPRQSLPWGQRGQLPVRLLVDPQEAANQDDVFYLVSHPPGVTKKLTVKDDARPGDRCVDLLFDDLDMNLRWRLEVDTDPAETRKRAKAGQPSTTRGPMADWDDYLTLQEALALSKPAPDPDAVESSGPVDAPELYQATSLTWREAVDVLRRPYDAARGAALVAAGEGLLGDAAQLSWGAGMPGLGGFGCSGLPLALAFKAGHLSLAQARLLLGSGSPPPPAGMAALDRALGCDVLDQGGAKERWPEAELRAGSVVFFSFESMVQDGAYEHVAVATGRGDELLSLEAPDEEGGAGALRLTTVAEYQARSLLRNDDAGGEEVESDPRRVVVRPFPY